MYMHQNTPNLNIYFDPPGLLGGSKSRFGFRRFFFAPNKKIKKQNMFL